MKKSETTQMNDYLYCKCERPELLPFRANPTDAGLDLKSKQLVRLQANSRTMVGTGVSVRIPPGSVGLLFARSSLSKKGIILANGVGVIDSDYRGEIMAPLIYIPIDKDHGVYQEINRDERIVQLVIMPISLPKPVQYTGKDWVDTARGEGGFGSTGKH